jgi:hypothetical protein
MFKRVLGATLTAVAAFTALTTATAAAAAPAVTHHVLTINKVGGANVKVGAILKANLHTGSTVVFASSSGKVVCKVSVFTVKVTKNPAKPGTALASLTSQTFSKCTTTFSGATGVKSVKLNHLPYKTTISDSTGFPVAVSGPSTTITLHTTVGTLSCVYKATAAKGNASNTAQTITFSKRPFSKSSGPAACPRKGTFSAAYGPVRDTSVTNSPHVFVN